MRSQGSSSSPGAALAAEMVRKGLCWLTESRVRNTRVVPHGKPDQTWLTHRDEAPSVSHG